MCLSVSSSISVTLMDCVERICQWPVKVTSATRDVWTLSWTSPPENNLGRVCCSRTTMQQSPHWLHGTSHIYPHNCPFPFDDNHPYLIHPFSTNPTHHHEWHLHPVNLLPQYTFQDRPIDDRPTHGPDDSSTPWALTLHSIAREPHAKIWNVLPVKLNLNMLCINHSFCCHRHMV